MSWDTTQNMQNQLMKAQAMALGGVAYQEPTDSLRSIRVDKSVLLKELQRNRDKHYSEYTETLADWRKVSKKVLEQMLAKVDSDDFEPLNISVKPMSHLGDYDRVIKMLELSKDSEFVLTERDFQRYVMDVWDWSGSFKLESTMYKDALRN